MTEVGSSAAHSGHEGGGSPMIFFEPLSIGESITRLMHDGLATRITAYDGSSVGPARAPIGIHLRNERALAYMITAPGELGLVRAYVSGDLDLSGVHPGDPYDALVLIREGVRLRMPSPAEIIGIIRALDVAHLRPPPPPPQEHPARWRRTVDGLRHSIHRDGAPTSRHYDVSNRFFELVLGPSMAYTCAAYESPGSSLETAHAEMIDQVCRDLDLKPGQRLLDVGSGWGALARHAAREYGVHVSGTTLSLAQAQWAQEAIEREGLSDLVEVRHLAYHEVLATGFDAVSSIGLTEHVAVRQFPAYFRHLHDRLKPGGRLVDHCVTVPHNHHQDPGPFVDRYILPDGQLSGSATVLEAAHRAGFAVQRADNLGKHYSRTLADWSRRLVDNWDECVVEVGEPAARVWGLFLAGARIGFDQGELELNSLIATKAPASLVR